MKHSIKREQSQAGLSFAERENRRSAAAGKANVRPKVKHLRFLILLALLTAAATGAWAESGTCGSNVHWTLEGGKMTISGTGKMTSWANANKVPWNNYKSQITSVVIGDGVTYIGEYAFEECVNIASVSFGKDVETIGMNAFYKCLSLPEVTIPASVETIGRDAFVNCMSLSKVTVLRPATDEVTKIIGSPFSNTIMATISVYNGLIYVPAGSGETYKAKWPVIYSDKILELIPTYSVKMKDGTKEAANWTISTGSGDNVRTATGSDADGLKGLYEGDAVTLKYSGRRKVKSVTATTDAAPAAYTMAANATAGDVGKLICTDGHIHTYNADAACTKSRVAMIAYVGIETGVAGYTHGLALALTDEGNNNWNNAKTACTNKNTSATVKSASWMLPSRTQWETMGATNSTYTTLRNGFTSVGGSNLVSYYYWSSTEHEEDPIYAWYFDFNLGSWVADYNDLEHLLVRACLAF